MAIADEFDTTDEEDTFDPFAEGDGFTPVAQPKAAPLEDAFRAQQPAMPDPALDDVTLGGAGNDRVRAARPTQGGKSIEDAFRAKPVPGMTLSTVPDNAPPITAPEAIPSADRATTQSKVTTDGAGDYAVSSQDHKSNFRDLVKLNPEVFGDIQKGIDPKNPNAVSQFNQANFWARVQSMPGGIETFNRAAATVKSAYLNKFVDERVREIFPGYGRGQKMPPQFKAFRDQIYNDMRMATAMQLNGIPAKKQNSLLGNSAAETITNVLKAPELDRDLLDGLEPKDRAKYLSAYIRHAAGKDKQLASDLRFQIAPLLLDEDGANYDRYVAEAFPVPQDGKAIDPANDPDQTWGGAIKGFLRGAKDWSVYGAGEAAKTPGYVASLMAAIPRKVTGKASSDISGNQALTDFGNWWTDGVSSLVTKGSSDAAVARREDFDKQAGAATEGKDGLDAARAYISTMAANPQTSFEQISGMIASTLAAGGGGVKIATTVAKGAAKEAGKDVAKVATKKAAFAGATGANAAMAGGQVQQQVYGQLVPQEGTPSYDVAVARFANSELSKAQQSAAKEGNYQYSAPDAFKAWAQNSADTAALLTSMAVVATSRAGGSIESLFAEKAAAKEGGKAAAKGAAKQAAQTAVVEGMSEAFEEYVAGVSTAYYNKVRDEYKTTGDADKLVRSLSDGNATMQAAVGFVLGGATGAGFAMLHNMGNHDKPDAKLPVPPTAEPPDASGPAPTTNTALDPETARAIAAQSRSLVQGTDGTYYGGSLESALRAPAAQETPTPSTALDPEMARVLAARSGQPTVGADGTIYGAPANIPDPSGPTPTTNTDLDPLTAQAVAAQYGKPVMANDGKMYLPPTNIDPKEANRDARRVAKGDLIGATREARSLEEQLRARDAAPADPELTDQDLIDLAENDPKAVELDAKVQRLYDERRALEGQNKKLDKSVRPGDIRQRNANVARIGEINDNLFEATAELNAYTKNGGRYTKVMVRDEDGTPTGVTMDRDEFDDLQTKQRQAKADSEFHANLADVFTKAQDDPAAAIIALEASKKTLPVALAVEMNAMNDAEIENLSERIRLADEKMAIEQKLLDDLEARKAKGEPSSAYMKAKNNARKRFNDAKGRKDIAQGRIDDINDIGSYNASSVKKTDAYELRLGAVNEKIAAAKADIARLKEAVDSSNDTADKALEDFTQETGFDADELYTNRQANVAQVPITETSVRRVVERFASAVKTASGKAIEIVILRSDTDFARVANDHGELPNDSFSTLSRTERGKKGQPDQQVIYVNAKRIEDAQAGQLEQELLSKAATSFVLPNLARTDPRFKVLLSNIAKVAYKSAFGKRVHRIVADGFYANGVSPSRDMFALSYVAELLRTAPKDELGFYDLMGSTQRGDKAKNFYYRTANAINNFLLNRFPTFARALGLSTNTADISKINELFDKLVRTDDMGHMPADVSGDWSSLFTEGRLDRQRREFVNTNRYVGTLGRSMQFMRDRFALTAAIDAQINKVSRNLAKLPEGVTTEQALAKLNDAMNAVELRVRRTDNRLRSDAEPLIQSFQTALRAAAAAAGDSVNEFTKKFDTYVQLLSMREMLSATGDFYLEHVKLSPDARKEFNTRFKQMTQDAAKVHNVEGRKKLAKDARADIDRIVALDQAGKPLQELSYAGFTLSDVNAELGAYASQAPQLNAAFEQLYPSLRAVIDAATEFDYESGKYDPLEIAFRNREHFVYRGGQEIDADKTDELSDPLGRSMAGRKATGTATDTKNAKGRKAMPKNTTVTVLNELVLSIDRAERGRAVEKVAFATQVDPKLLAKSQGSKKGTRKAVEPLTRSEPTTDKSGHNYFFDYLGAPNEGSTKSVQYVATEGPAAGHRVVLTFAHEDILNGLRQHSVTRPSLKVLAAIQGAAGSLYTTRNPFFVTALQAPRDFIHNTFTIIAPRHGAMAAFEYPGRVVMNAAPVWRYATMTGPEREAYIAELKAKDKSHPLVVYAEQGGWFGAHAQHSALDLAAQIKERGFIQRGYEALPMGKTAASLVKHLLDTLPEAADNLFRVAYVDVAADPKTKNSLDAETAVTRAGQIMDFSSGSEMQRMVAPWAPFARAWVNGAYNLMFRDLWQGGALPVKEVNGIDGRKIAVDWGQARKQMKPSAVAGIMLTSGALYAMARAFAGPDDPPPTAEDLANGLLIPGTGMKMPYQYGWNKIMGSLGSLSMAVADGTITPDQAQRAWVNVWLKEATPFGLQYIPTTEQASWAKTMVSQAFGTNAITKLIAVPAIGVDSFGKPIFGRTAGAPKPTTPDAYASVAGDENADLVSYLSGQFGIISNIVDGIARYSSDNLTDDQKSRSVARLTGTSSWSVGRFGVQEKLNGQETSLVSDYEAKLAAVKRTPDKKDDRALRKAPGGASIEAYLKLDRRLGKQYSDMRKKWVGKPEFSQKMKALNDRQAQVRQRALDRIKKAKAQASAGQ